MESQNQIILKEACLALGGMTYQLHDKRYLTKLIESLLVHKVNKVIYEQPSNISVFSSLQILEFLL